MSSREILNEIDLVEDVLSRIDDLASRTEWLHIVNFDPEAAYSIGENGELVEIIAPEPKPLAK